MSRLAGLAARVGRLADALAGLRERVRAAVAAELRSAVGAAVRDLVRVLAHGDAAGHGPSTPFAFRDRDGDDDRRESSERRFDLQVRRVGQDRRGAR